MKASLRRTRLSAPKIATTVQKRYLQDNNRFFKVSEEVRHAVNHKLPVVALETTIYTHGFPHPDNVNLATLLDRVVRENGGVPAHCALIDGIARVGISGVEMERLLQDSNAKKVSRRDLAYIGGQGLVGTRLNGGTTISGTMILAHLAGIRVFATGGLGGVHRGVESTMDVSADLTELGRTPVAVISSGCKGFLDIPRTLEYLETAGVLVATFADEREGPVKFPAFWSRESSMPSPFTIRDEQEAAALIHAQFGLPLSSGMLLANPVPREYSIDSVEMASIIEEAVRQANAAGVSGAANTPWVLNAIKELSGGKSIPANRALIESNVIRGTRVAVELSKLDNGLQNGAHVGLATSRPSPRSDRERPDRPDRLDPTTDPSTPLHSNEVKPVDIVVVGSVALDLACDLIPADSGSSAGRKPVLETSNKSSITQRIGGVSYNVARASHLAGGSVMLLSRIGSDLAGNTIRNGLELGGLSHRLSVSSEHQTAQYVAINDADMDLVLGMADMRILEDVPQQAADEILNTIMSSEPKWLVIDANWSPGALIRMLDLAKSKGILTAFEPVSIAKCARMFPSLGEEMATFPKSRVDLITPNKLELISMYDAAKAAGHFEQQSWWEIIDSLGISSAGARVKLAMTTTSALVDEGIPQRTIQLLPFIPRIVTKLGAEGVLVTQLLAAEDPRLGSPDAAPYLVSRAHVQGGDVGGVYMRLFPASVVAPQDIVSVNGAGDTFLGVMMAILTKRDGIYIEDSIDIAQRASLLTLASAEAVSPRVEELRLSLEAM